MSLWPAKTEHIPYFTPHFSYVPKASMKEKYADYCRARLLQFKPGSNPDNLLTDFQTYSEAMDDFVKTSNHCPNLLKEEVEFAHNKNAKEEEDEEEEEENQYAGFPDLLPETGGNLIGNIVHTIFFITLLLEDKLNEHEMLQDLIALKALNLEAADFEDDAQSDTSGYEEDQVVAEAKEIDWSASYREMGLNTSSLRVINTM